MTRWQYTEVWVQADNGYRMALRREQNKKRQTLGLQGWECYAVTRDKYGDQTYYFKRPILTPEVQRP